MEKEKQLLLLCTQQIEQSLKWGDSEAWSNDDFEHLSQKIFDKTRVQLSISTLKRIWGKVRYENFPATGTLNALARYLDYDSWREFRQKNDGAGTAPDNESRPPVISLPGQLAGPPVKQNPGAGRTIGYLLLAAAAIVVIAALFRTIRKNAAIDPSKIKFEARMVSDTLPNSVIFNYDASAFHSDSVYIQQSWDPRRRERVDGNGKQHTSIYYNPGYFIASLVVNNQIKKQCIVSIQTKGWKGIIEESLVPVYLSAKEIKGDGFMGISSQLLQQKAGSPVFNGLWVKFANVRDFKNIDANNFTFETDLRNSSAVEASVCREVKAIILLKGSAIIIPLANKGCISELNLLTGNAWISGKDHDLSAFGCDFSKFHNLKFTVENKHLKVYLDGKMILDNTLKYKLSEIAGIRYEFEGAGMVKDVKLTTPGAGTYFEQF